MLKKGYTLQFCRQPPTLNSIVHTALPSVAERAALEEEIALLLRKGAIVMVPQLEAQKCFFFLNVFLSSQELGGYETKPQLAHTEWTHRAVSFPHADDQTIGGMHPTMWLHKIHRIYFHISILPQHRKYLRFTVGKGIYQYCCLPFSYSLTLTLTLTPHGSLPKQEGAAIHTCSWRSTSWSSS